MEDNQKRRFVNFRSFLWIALSIIAAVLFMQLNFFVSSLGFVLLGGEALFWLTLFLIYAYRGAEKFKLVTCIAAIVLSVVAGLNFYLTVQNTQYLREETLYLIDGKTDEIDYENDRILLKDLWVDGVKTDGNIVLYTDFEQYTEFYALRVGDHLIFEAELNQNPILDANRMVNAYVYRTGIKYRCYDFSETVLIEKAEADLFQTINEKMKFELTEAMGAEHGLAAYGMITGRTEGIDVDLRDAYSASGLAHILSVSGLHVGFLSGALLFIFRALRVKKTAANLTTIGILFFYAFFTGFSPPVLRASIMATIMLLGMLLSRRYDPLNGLATAVSAILIFAPILLFDAGFILSVCSVLGIVLFSRPITAALLKLKLPKFLARATAVSAAAQAGIMPVMIVWFKSVQIYAVIINVLVLPIVNAAFVVILLSLLLTLVFKPFIILLKLSGILMALIDTVAVSAAILPFASITIASGVYTGVLFLCYLGYFFASRFVMRPAKKLKFIRSTVCLVLSAAICLSVVLSTQYYPGDFIAPVSGYRDVTTVVRHRDKTYIVGDFKNFRSVDNTLKELNIQKIDGIFLFALDEDSAKTLVRFSKRYRAGTVLCYEGADLSGLSVLVENGIGNFYTFNGLSTVAADLGPVVTDGRLLAYELYTENGGILLCGYKTNYTHIPAEAVDRAYAIRCFAFSGAYPERIFLTNIEPVSGETPSYGYSTAEDGAYLFDFTSGKMCGLG